MTTAAVPRTEPATQALGVLVVDDHHVFAQLVAFVLSSHDDLECLGIATTVAKALELTSSLEPDIVLMDVQLGDDDGVAATAELMSRHTGLRVVVLSAFIDRPLMRRAATAGACALLPKDGDLSEMLHALRTARRGDFVVQPRLLRQLVAERQVPAQRMPPFTTREHDVLRLLAAGLDAGVIARELGISVHTCRGYVKTLLAKLGAHSQLEAVVIAMRHGLIAVGDAAT
jgi:DNA-binding NarL/FixJ family response regulator